MANWSNEYYRRSLRGLDLRVYDAICAGWQSCQDAIALPDGVTAGYDTSRIVECVALDHPEIFWVDYYAYNLQSQTLAGRLISLHARFNCFYGAQELQGLQRQAAQWRQRILSQIGGRWSASDKAWMLYDYLSRQVTYGEKGHAQSHTIIGCMLPQNHISVCEGIAKGYKFLCDGLDLPCIIVMGDVAESAHGRPERHAWNIVQADEGLRHLDVTSELTRAKADGIAPRTGFMHDDGQMAHNHYHWNTAAIPACR